jgi:hypothetical protein
MHACIHTCIHTCLHTYMHTYIQTCIHTCVHTYMHECAMSLNPTRVNFNVFIRVNLCSCRYSLQAEVRPRSKVEFQGFTLVGGDGMQSSDLN